MSRATTTRSALLATALTACAAATPRPPETPPALATRRDVVPSPAPSRMTLRLSFPLEGLEALLRQAIALPESAEFRPVTAKKANPEVEARYASSLADVRWQSHGHTLQLRAEIRYHAELRARAQTPFGRIWLTKGTAWGTPEAPGRIELTLQSPLAVRPDWRLDARPKLTGVELTAPAAKKVCAKGPMTVCVDARLVERTIHGQLERAVRAAVRAELAKLNDELVEQVPLRQAAEQLWRGLQESGQRVGLTPEALAVGAPKLGEERLALDVRVRMVAGGSGGAAARALPKAREKLEGPDMLHLQLRMGWSQLDAQFDAALPKAVGDTAWRLRAVAVRGPASEPGRYWLAATLRRRGRERTVHLNARLAPEGSALTLRDVRFSEPSATWLKDAGLATATDATLGGIRADLTDAIRARRDRVARALAGSAGWVVPVELVGLDDYALTDVHAQASGIGVQAVVR